MQKGCRTTQVRHSARERRPAWNKDVVKHGTNKTETRGAVASTGWFDFALSHAKGRVKHYRIDGKK
jgi:hypothetical protein